MIDAHAPPLPAPSPLPPIPAPRAPGGESVIKGRSSRQATVSVGMAVALGAVAMTFAALFLAYAIIRVQAPIWPPPGEPVLMRGWTWSWLASATISALVGSGALRAAARRGDVPSARLLAITAASGASFIALQLTAWARLASDGFRPSSGLMASVVYALTLFHALHAAVAVVVLLPLVVRTMRGRPVGAPTFAAVSSFWHLVTIVWLVVATAILVA